jgi:hypothetical protein
MCKIKYESYVRNYVFLVLARVMLETTYLFSKVIETMHNDILL